MQVLTSLTCADYYIFLEEVLPSLRDIRPQHVRCHVSFQHDEVLLHYDRYVREHLNQVFGNQYIGHSGPVH